MKKTKKLFISAICIFSLSFSACQSKKEIINNKSFVDANKEEQAETDLYNLFSKKYGIEERSQDHRSFMTEVKDFSLNLVLLKTDNVVLAPGTASNIYFSIGLLKEVALESEFAFLLFFAEHLVKNKATLRSIAKIEASQLLGQSIFGLPTAVPSEPKGLFNELFVENGLYDFGDDEYVSAIRGAVKRMHETGYDTRGSSTLFQKWASQNKFSSHTDFRWVLPKMLDCIKVAKDASAKLSPTKNPTVNSIAFEKWSKRISTRKSKK